MSEERRPMVVLAFLIGLLLVLYGAWHWSARHSWDVPHSSLEPPSTPSPSLGSPDGRPGPPGGGPGKMRPGKMGSMFPRNPAGSGF